VADELQQILAGQRYQTEKLESIDQRLKELNGSVRSHEVRLSVLEAFTREQVKPALERLIDVRIELARWGMFGGVGGFVVMVGFILGRFVLGWW